MLQTNGSHLPKLSSFHWVILSSNVTAIKLNFPIKLHLDFKPHRRLFQLKKMKLMRVERSASQVNRESPHQWSLNGSKTEEKSKSRIRFEWKQRATDKIINCGIFADWLMRFCVRFMTSIGSSWLQIIWTVSLIVLIAIRDCVRRGWLSGGWDNPNSCFLFVNDSRLRQQKSKFVVCSFSSFKSLTHVKLNIKPSLRQQTFSWEISKTLTFKTQILLVLLLFYFWFSSVLFINLSLHKVFLQGSIAWIMKMISRNAKATQWRIKSQWDNAVTFLSKNKNEGKINWKRHVRSSESSTPEETSMEWLSFLVTSHWRRFQIFLTFYFEFYASFHLIILMTIWVNWVFWMLKSLENISMCNQCWMQ